MASAFAPDLEKELQQSLIQSSKLVQQALQKQKNAAAIDDEITRLKDISESIKINHALLQERFRLRKEAVNNLGANAQGRQRVMEAGYLKALGEYLILSEQLSAISGQLNPEQTSLTLQTQQTLQSLKTLLDKILPKKKRPIFGNLPYENLNYPAREPDASPAIKPAYKGGNRIVSPDDTKSTEEAPISKEIAEFAQSLNWKPVAIYEYIKNNIETEWYWGCQKGAEETLRQKSGNDCDQATLLAALLRASGFPTRYVRGTIEFFAGGRDGINIDKVKNLTGIDDPLKIAEFFQKAGIPYKPVIQGGKITNFQIEHIWVESRIPYGNYRGTMIDNSDPTWLGLDTSIKPEGYAFNNPLDILQTIPLSNIKEEYLGSLHTETPLDYLKARLFANNQQSIDNYKLSGTLIPQVLDILPSSMQFDQKKITHEYTQIPEDLKHRVRFVASNPQSPAPDSLSDITLDTMKLSNRQIVLTYEPETVEDQQIIDSYGGLDNTPAYLVRLRPVLKVNEERMVVGRDGLPMGEEYNLTIALISPNGIERVTNTHIIGNLAVIGIVAGKVTPSISPLPQGGGNAEDDAESILYKEANRYIDRWNRAEDELASLLHLTVTRPIPTVVTVGGVIDVTYLLDMPHGFEWKGVYVDAALRSASPVTRYASPVTAERQKTFMQLSGLQGSVLEHKIFEDDFQVESISTAKLIQIVGANGGSPILTIDKTNIAALLSASDLADNIKEDIINAVNQGLVVRIPSANSLLLNAISYKDWSGTGYIKENPSTGEAGYMLSGMIAGGMSVITPANWSNKELKDILSNPNSKESNNDPMSAFKIAKFSATDRQRATVGKRLDRDIEVIVVDKNNKRVKGATVIFTAVAGDGNFGKNWLGQVKTSHEATTSINGTATAPFNVGTETGKNPGYLKLTSTDQYVTQIGINVVTVTVKSAIGNISLSPPFESYGTPDLPFEIKKVLGNGTVGLANNPTGSLVAKVLDKHGNPISNQSIRMKIVGISPRYIETVIPPQPRGVEFYDSKTCANPYPLYGDCASKSEATLKTEYYGAVTNGFFGDTVATKYNIEAAVTDSNNPNILPAYFELYTTGFRSTDNYIPPGVYLRYLQPVNDYGQPINASKAGTPLKAPLMAEFILMRDDIKLEGPAPCSSGEGACWNLATTGKVITEKITNGTVAFAAVSGDGTAGQTVNLGNGKYRTTYTTGPQPMVNLVEAGGTATITVPKVLYNPMVTGTVMPSFGADYPGTPKPLAITEYRTEQLQCTLTGCSLPTADIILKGGQQAIFFAGEPPLAAGNELKAKYTVYGVDVTLAMEPKVLILNDGGYSFADMKLSYTVIPPEYNAAMADIDLYKADLWQTYLAGGKTQGTDSGIITAGSVFDADSAYSAQVILNRGSDMEIRGAKTALPVGLIRIVDDEDGATPMQGTVTDGAAKLRLQLSVKNNREAVTGLTWQLIDPQVMDYTPASIRGGFVDGENIVDSLPVTFNVDGVSEAVYRAPETFVRWGMPQEAGDKDLKERYIQPTIDLANYFKTRKDPLPPIRLKRPPVVLVHGLWGCGNPSGCDGSEYAWKTFESKFNPVDKGLYDIFSVDYYERTAAKSVAVHAPKLRKRINSGIGELRTKGFAVSKFDIIAHSMGGLLTREYCKQYGSECQEKIRRFVTIDTPHVGSELADLLLVYRDPNTRNFFSTNQDCLSTVDSFERGSKIRVIWPYERSVEPHPLTPKDGAIDDLATGALPPQLPQGLTSKGRWKDYPALSQTLSAHTIVGLTGANADGYDIEIFGLWRYIISRCGFTRVDIFGAEADANDRIVKQTSQIGGVLDKHSTKVYDTDHFSVRNSIKTIDRIRALIDEPRNSELFTK